MARNQNVIRRKLCSLRRRTTVVVLHYRCGKQQAAVPDREVELSMRTKRVLKDASAARTPESEVR